MQMWQNLSSNTFREKGSSRVLEMVNCPSIPMWFYWEPFLKGNPFISHGSLTGIPGNPREPKGKLGASTGPKLTNAITSKCRSGLPITANDDK